MDPTDKSSHPLSIHRVVHWTLEDTAEVRTRHEAQAASAAAESARAELSKLSDTYGFTLDAFVEALATASSSTPSPERAAREVAKSLRAAGYKADSGKVRRIQQLIERCMPEILPETLRPGNEVSPH